MAKIEPVDETRWKFWCPGCNGTHQVSTSWTVDVSTVTINPSILVYETPVQPRCHSFVTNGRIQFLDDSTHALKGQTVDLPDWNDNWPNN